MLGTVGVICVHCFIGQVSPVLFLCSLFPNRRFFDDFLITNAGFFFASRLEPPDEQRDLIDHVGIGRVGRGCQFRVFTKLSQDVEARLNLVINWCWIRFRHMSMVACFEQIDFGNDEFRTQRAAIFGFVILNEGLPKTKWL